MADQQPTAEDLKKEQRLESLDKYRKHSRDSVKGPLGSCLGRTFDFISKVVRDGLDEEVLYSIETLVADRHIAFKHDKEKADPVRNTVYNLTHALGMMVESMVEQRLAEKLAADAATANNNYSPQESFSQDSDATLPHFSVKEEAMDFTAWVAPPAPVPVAIQKQQSTSYEQQDVKPEVHRLQQPQPVVQKQQPIVQPPLPLAPRPQPVSQPQKRASAEKAPSPNHKRPRTDEVAAAASTPAASAAETHQCMQCPRSFPTSCGLIRHSLHHTSIRCNICDQFVLKENFDDHKTAHDGEKEKEGEVTRRTTRSTHEEDKRAETKEDERSKRAARRSAIEEEKTSSSSRSTTSRDYADLDHLDTEMEEESRRAKKRSEEKKEKRKSSRSSATREEKEGKKRRSERKSRKGEKSIWDMDDDGSEDDEGKEARESRRSRRDVSTTSSVKTAIATDNDGLKCPVCATTIEKEKIEEHMEVAHNKGKRRAQRMSEDEEGSASEASSSSSSDNSSDGDGDPEYVDEKEEERMKRKRTRRMLKIQKKKDRKEKEERKKREEKEKEDSPATTKSDDIFSCNQCTRFFTSQAGLNAHTQMHFGVKCQICKKRFATDKIMDHMDNAHGSNPTDKREEINEVKRDSSVVSIKSTTSSHVKAPQSTSRAASDVSTTKPTTSTAVKAEATSPAVPSATPVAPIADVKDVKPVFGPGNGRPAEGPAKCKECSRVFDTQRGLNNHAHTHWGVGCLICKQRIHALKLADHYAGNHPGKTPPITIKCTHYKCEVYKLDANDMEKHVKAAHAPESEQ